MKNKIYLITGATGAIGGAIARKLDSLEARLILAGRDIEKIQCFVDHELIFKNHIVLNLDLENVGMITDAIKLLTVHSIKIDGLIYAAGIGEVRPLKMTTTKFMEKVFNVNFMSFIELVRLINTPKFRNETLNIVGVSAIGAYQGNATKTAYSASKAAMNAATRCLAVELAEKGVRINTVAPGATYSKMMDEILNLPGGASTLNKIKERQFLGVCSPDDIAEGIFFLLSDASRMITGSCLPIDGGKLST
jgi:NAD(P)-dependent dehydrogenase (short-subunit alcohol dehydrogenase family)